MGRQRAPRGRPVDGVLLLDKPAGLTSNEALQRVKRLFDARKAGHTGSLDPLASGLLPVCFGQATKVSAFLLDADKRYEVRAKLGAKTDTGDAEGSVVATSDKVALDGNDVQRVLEEFTGDILQVPPMYSAVKHQGRRLYQLAREGLEVERAPRPLSIHEIALIDMREDMLALNVHCSKGTYVRTLVEDIAERLGTLAHVVALRRTAVGPYRDDESVTMTEIEERAGAGVARLDALLRPLDSAIAQWPSVRLERDSAYYLMHGQPVVVPRAPTRGLVRLYAEDARFIGMGQVMDDGRVAPKRLFTQ